MWGQAQGRWNHLLHVALLFQTENPSICKTSINGAVPRAGIRISWSNEFKVLGVVPGA